MTTVVDAQMTDAVHTRTDESDSEDAEAKPDEDCST